MGLNEDIGTFYDRKGEAYECRKVIFRQTRAYGEIYYELENRLWVKSTEIVGDKKNLIQGDWVCVSHVDGETLGIKESQFEGLMFKGE